MSFVFGSFAIAFPILLSGVSGIGATIFCLSHQRKYLRGSEKLSDTLIGNAAIGALIITLASGSAFWMGQQIGELPQNLIAKENLK